MKTRLWHAALLVCMSAPIVQALQGNPAPAIARHSAAPTYRISGKVVDAHTGAALARCSVQIADVKERSESRTVTSPGDEGVFSFGWIALAGKYRLTSLSDEATWPWPASSTESTRQQLRSGSDLLPKTLSLKLTSRAVICGNGDRRRGAGGAAQVRLFEDDER